ncbi:MAG: hypothetical protein RI906_12 [Pseudomonadota bacterium]
MKTSPLRISGLAMASFTLLALTACATPEPDSSGVQIGQAVRQARALQTIDLSAAERAPVEGGADAGIAVSAWQRYQESFRAPAQSFEIFGIGGASR